MSDGGLTILDGTTLRDIHLRLPNTNGAITGAQLLTIAETQTSPSFFGLPLPETLKCNALKRIHIDAVNFPLTELNTAEEAKSKLNDYVIALADELKDDPIVISILDGSPLRLFLEDEDDFAMLAENLFTDLDVADTGKIKKNKIRDALVNMGVELGVPSISEFPLLEEILKKHGADGEEELGQAQFAESLQPVLQELADALAEKHVVVIQNIKVSNGSKLRKLLANEVQLNEVIEKILGVGDEKDERECRKAIRDFLEKNGPMLALPAVGANDAIPLLYDQVLAVGDNEKLDGRALVKEILGKLADQLEVNPIFHDLEN
ncbi:hypothetical protein ACHQM5_027407 [Ranunculus cassubicifolius]